MSVSTVVVSSFGMSPSAINAPDTLSGSALMPTASEPGHAHGVVRVVNEGDVEAVQCRSNIGPPHDR